MLKRHLMQTRLPCVIALPRCPRSIGSAQRALPAGGGGGNAYGGPSFAGSGPAATGERTVVVVGDYLNRNSPRMQQLHYQDIVDAAYGSQGVTSR